VLSQRTRQPGLARPGQASNEHTVPALDPVAQHQTHHRTAIQAMPGAGVDIVNARLREFQVSLVLLSDLKLDLWFRWP